MDPAPKLSISYVSTQYQFSNAYLLEWILGVG